MTTVAQLVPLASASAFTNSSYSKTAPTQTTSGAAWPEQNATKSLYVYLHTSETVAQGTQFYFGTNLPVYLEQDLVVNPTTYTQMSSSGIQLLRFPGGSPANKYLWDANYTRFSTSSQHCCSHIRVLSICVLVVADFPISRLGAG